jgi:hypothetical protein
VLRRRSLLFLFVAGVLSAGVLAASSISASAAPSITVAPSSGLTDGATVTVGVSGFTDGPGAITQCNNAAGQPTIQVAGNDVPVSCSDPFKNLQNVVGGGFNGKPFVVHTGTVGPPAQGTDSAGKPAADDAALYPCPPTAAQASAGAKCIIAFGNANKEQATADIAFQSSGGGTVGQPVQVSVGGTTTTGVTVATTSTTAPAQVLGTQITTPAASAAGTGGAPPPGEVARTGPGDFTLAMSVAGIALLDLGYLAHSSTRAPSRLLGRRRRRKGVVPGA